MGFTVFYRLFVVIGIVESKWLNGELLKGDLKRNFY